MRSNRDHLRRIGDETQRSREHLSNIEDSSAATARSAAQNTQLLKGIAYTNRVNMVFNGITAMNSARQLRTQKQQLALQNEQHRLQQEQHALQQAVSAQTARHEFSMWRQTPEGVAFVEWQERAVSLLPFLRSRERTWSTAWANAIERTRAEVPEGEKQRIRNHPARLKQNGLRIASFVAFAVAVLCAISFGFQLFFYGLVQATGGGSSERAHGSITYEECLDILADPDNIIMNESDCEAIRPVENTPPSIVPLVLAAGTCVGLVIARKVRQRTAQNDPTLEQESRARIARWGFDPLSTQGVGFPWHESEGFAGYADNIEHMLHSAPSTRPMPSQLIPLQVPTPLQPSERLPGEANDVLVMFHEENEQLSR